MSSSSPLLRTIRRSDLPPRAARLVLDSDAVASARRIVADVQSRGWDAVVEWSRRLGDVAPGGSPRIHARAELEAAVDRAGDDAALLARAADRIESFARAQRACLTGLDHPIPGGAAGHGLAPVESAGCYAPGGRFPLPSSVLMTAIPARVAGVRRIIVASPRPTVHTLAAAAIAGADALVSIGGAQAVAALALGAGDVHPCDLIVGPGNRYVTAAKQILAGVVGIDMLAGPSEVVVIADDSADARRVAADLLAQAEHDSDARAILLTPSPALIDAVNAELSRQLHDLPTAETSRAALVDSFCVHCESLEECAEVASQLAPEHVQVITREAPALALRVRHFGAAFIGPHAAEVLGDYAAGPNHVLPTGGTARFGSGLSVFTFLRVRTWLRIDDAGAARDLYADAAALAGLEHLPAHARAAAARLTD